MSTRNLRGRGISDQILRIFFPRCRRSKIFDSAVAPSSLCQPSPTGESPGACADAGRAARPGRARGDPGRAASLAHRPRLTRRHCAAMGCRKSRTNPKQRGGWGGALVAERSGSRWCVGLAPRAPHFSRDRPLPASPPPPSLFVQLWPQRYQATIAFHVTREPTQRCGGPKPCVCVIVCVCVGVQDSLFDELSYENSMRMMGQMGQPTQLHPLQVRPPPPFAFRFRDESER